MSAANGSLRIGSDRIGRFLAGCGQAVHYLLVLAGGVDTKNKSWQTALHLATVGDHIAVRGLDGPSPFGRHRARTHAHSAVAREGACMQPHEWMQASGATTGRARAAPRDAARLVGCLFACLLACLLASCV